MWNNLIFQYKVFWNQVLENILYQYILEYIIYVCILK